MHWMRDGLSDCARCSVRFENLKNFQICISNILRWRRLDEKQEETVFNKNVDLKTFSKVTNPPQKEISEFDFRILQISFECLIDTENVDQINLFTSMEGR